MKANTISIEFTKPIRDFLEKQGFTHILSLGISPDDMNDASEIEDEKEKYWLEPIKADDPRLRYQETDHLIQTINDTEVFDMSTGQDEIKFMINLPSSEYEQYLNIK